MMYYVFETWTLLRFTYIQLINFLTVSISSYTQTHVWKPVYVSQNICQYFSWHSKYRIIDVLLNYLSFQFIQKN